MRFLLIPAEMFLMVVFLTRNLFRDMRDITGASEVESALSGRTCLGNHAVE
jgi:hypothetical protein